MDVTRFALLRVLGLITIVTYTPNTGPTTEGTCVLTHL